MTLELTIAVAQVLHDAYSVNLNHFGYVGRRLEYAGVGESLDDASLAEGCASGCGICEMLEQTNDTMLDFDVGLWTKQCGKIRGDADRGPYEGGRLCLCSSQNSNTNFKGKKR
jgi:hypothetical protein